MLVDLQSFSKNIKGKLKFNYSLNQFVSSIEFFESIVAFKINRNLTFENILVENNGLKSKNEDMTIDKSFINFIFKVPNKKRRSNYKISINSKSFWDFSRLRIHYLQTKFLREPFS